MGNGCALITTVLRTFGLLAVASSMGLGADSVRDPAEVMKQVVAKVREAVTRSVSYTCVETVERDFYRPAASTLERPCSTLLELRKHPTLDMVLRPLYSDRLRLDVTLARGGEMYSWVGASHFEDAGIYKVVKEGPIDSGAFAALLDVVFLEDVKDFHFEGHKVIDGKDLMEYSFEVAKANSNDEVSVQGSFVKTAYSGSVWVNPATNDVVRIRVKTAELPAESGACEIDKTLDFGKVAIGNALLLLPTLSQTRFVAPDGIETENNASFANCREYQGESTISYSAPPPSAASAANGDVPAPPPRAPGGLRFTMDLVEPIDTARAAAGDLFRARLVQPLRDRKSKVIARSGSMVEGRLLRVQSIHILPKQVLVVFAPRELQIDGEKVPFAGIRDWTRLWAEARGGFRRPAVKVLMPDESEAPAGVFTFPGEHAVIRKGFRSDWWTALPDAGRGSGLPAAIH